MTLLFSPYIEKMAQVAKENTYELYLRVNGTPHKTFDEKYNL
jgi:hypothetical protein